MTDVPWDDAKVAFGITDDERLWTLWESNALTLPEGWELNETDSSGARCVAVFRVEGLIKPSDGFAVVRTLKQEGIF